MNLATEKIGGREELLGATKRAEGCREKQVGNEQQGTFEKKKWELKKRKHW